MRKTFLVFLLVFVVLGGGAYYLVTSRVVDELQQAQRQLAPVGTLQYGAVRITPAGALHIHQLAFYPHASNDVLRVGRVSLVTDNLFTLLQIASVVQQNKTPDSLRFELHDVEMDVRGDWLANVTDSPSSGAGRHLYAAGCAERDHFTYSDLDVMGYQNPRSDMSLEYRWSVNTSRFLILGELTAQGMYQLMFNVDMMIQDDIADPMAAMLATQVRRLEFSYTDLGFANSVISFCAQETGLTQEVYLEQHLDAWQTMWRDAQIEMGVDLVEGYREFMQEPGRLTLEAFPDVSIMQLAMAGSLEATLAQLAPQMTVNGGAPRQVELAFIDRTVERARTPDASQSSPGSGSRSAITSRSVSPGRTLAVTELGSFLERGVVVRLNDGRRYEGVIVSVENERLHLRRILFNGQMVMPVRFDDIGDVRLQGS